MARLQVIHLPAPADEFPFALIVDELGPDELPELNGSVLEAMRVETGARFVLVFPITVEVV